MSRPTNPFNRPQTAVLWEMTRRLSILAIAVLNALLLAAPASAQSVLLRFGSRGTADRQFDGPASLAVDADGRIVVADAGNHRVQVFDAQGQFIRTFGSAGERSGQFRNPIGVAVDRTGNIYVADQGNSRVQKFDPSGRLLLKFGARGSADGQFGSLVGIAVDTFGRIVTADGLSRIQVFDRTGKFLFKFGAEGSDPGQFRGLSGVCTDANDRIYAADNSNHRVQIFDRTGKFVSTFGSRGGDDGQFVGPANVAVDRFGIIYVADVGNRRIQKFERSGRFLLKYGPASGPDALGIPLGMAVDPIGNLVVSDFENNYVAKIDVLRNFLFSMAMIGPDAVSIDPATGDLLVSHVRIDRYDADGKFLEQIRRDQYEYSWLAQPNVPGEFVLAVALGAKKVIAYKRFLTGLFEFIYSMEFTSGSGGISADSRFVYMADPGTHSINLFAIDAVHFPPLFARKYTYDGERPFDPKGIKGVNGVVYAVDYANRRVVKFDDSGRLALKVGTRGSGPGQFESPIGVDVDGLGGIYVTDNQSNTVQKFDRFGTLQYRLGGEGSRPYNLHSPAGVAVSKAGRIYVADFLGAEPDPVPGGRVVAFADDIKSDHDLDGLLGTDDLDQDGDGIPDEVEGDADTDADARPDSLDLDADGDGLCDVMEAGLADLDGDCRFDDAADDNKDGFADSLDPAVGGVPVALLDTDGDGTPDFRDGDSDDDGRCDVSETRGGVDRNQDCIYDDEADLDEDGLPDALYVIGGTPLELRDSDRDGVFDQLDADQGGGAGGGGCSLTSHATATPAALLSLLLFPAVVALRRAGGTRRGGL
jgi:DNA-binding beta-propeller fold protein YncE